MISSLLALYPVVRGLIYVGLLLLVGSQAGGALLQRETRIDPDLAAHLRRRTSRLPVILSALLIIAIVIRGGLQALSFHDPGDPFDLSLFEGALLSGSWGHAWMLQLGAVIVLLAIARFRRGYAGISDLLIGGMIGVVLWAQTGMGHSAGDNWPGWLGRVVDFGHLLGAGLWIGTLGVVLLVGLPLLSGEPRLPILAHVVRRFSLYARTGVALVVISGVTAALVYARGSIAAIPGSAWGRLLLFKLACLLGVAALGWYNWRVVTPTLHGSHVGASGRLRTAIRVELGLSLVMLAITAVLVATALPGES